MYKLSFKELAQLSSLRIVGEFSLKNCHFLILFLEKPPEDNQEAPLSFAPDTCPPSVAGYFEVEGNIYAIVRVQEASGDLDPSLTTLLTGRELQIVALVAIGRCNKQIASQLRISEWTVSSYLRRIFIKLGVDSRAAMVYRCASMLHQIHQLWEVQQQELASGSSSDSGFHLYNRETFRQRVAEISYSLCSRLGGHNLAAEE